MNTFEEAPTEVQAGDSEPPPPRGVLPEPVRTGGVTVGGIRRAPEPDEFAAVPPPAGQPMEPFAEFEGGLAGENTRIEDRDVLAEQSTAILGDGPPMPYLFVESGKDQGREYVIQDGETSIGRGIDNDVILADVSVSRRHFRIQREAGQITLRDLGSGNGTQVNGRRAHVEVLSDGDRIELGETVLVLRNPGAQLPVDPGTSATNETAMPISGHVPAAPVPMPPLYGTPPAANGPNHGHGGISTDSLVAPRDGRTQSVVLPRRLLFLAAAGVAVVGSVIGAGVVSIMSNSPEAVATPIAPTAGSLPPVGTVGAPSAGVPGSVGVPPGTAGVPGSAGVPGVVPSPSVGVVPAPGTVLPGAVPAPGGVIAAGGVTAPVPAPEVVPAPGVLPAAGAGTGTEAATHETPPGTDTTGAEVATAPGGRSRPDAERGERSGSGGAARSGGRSAPIAVPRREGSPEDSGGGGGGGGRSAALTRYRAADFAGAARLAREAAGSASGRDRSSLEQLANNIESFAEIYPRLRSAGTNYASVASIGALAIRLDRSIASGHHTRTFEAGFVDWLLDQAEGGISTDPAGACRQARSAGDIAASSRSRTLIGRCEERARTMMAEASRAERSDPSRARELYGAVIRIVPGSSEATDARRRMDALGRSRVVDEDE